MRIQKREAAQEAFVAALCLKASERKLSYETFDLKFEWCGHTVKIPLMHNADASRCYIYHPELLDQPYPGMCPECKAKGAST